MNHTPLSPAQQSLLRATQILTAASQTDVPVDFTARLPRLQLLATVRMITWQARALLPDGVPVEPATPGRPGLLAALEAAEEELRTCPYWQYPDGTAELVVAMCDTIAGARAGALI